MKPDSRPSGNTFYFLPPDREISVSIRDTDWSSHALGAPASWPAILRASLGFLLSSPFPMCLWWGKEALVFYNDAFNLAFFNGSGPAVGTATEQSGSTLFEDLEAVFVKVRSGQRVMLKDHRVSLKPDLSGRDSYWNIRFDPIYNENGYITGILAQCEDRTGSVKTKNTTAAPENRFSTLVQEAAIGIIVLEGEDNKVAIANNAYLKLIGKQDDNIIGKPLFEVIPETAPYFKDIIDTARKSKIPRHLVEHPYFVIDACGERLEGFLDVIYQPYNGDGEQDNGVMILCQDVTQQVVTRKQLADSEAQVRAVIESAPFPIGVYHGREMTIALANKSILNVWDKGTEILGKTYFEVLPELENQNIYPELLNVYDTGIPFHARNQSVDLMVGGRLQRYYFNYSFTPLLDASGRTYGVMNTAADVTDLVRAKLKIEQSQKNFSSLILQAPVAMCLLVGPDHKVEIANEMMINIWGKSKQEVMDKPIFEGLPDARQQGLEELLDHVYASGETFTANEMPVQLIRFGKQDVVYQNFVYEPYRDGKGRIKGVIAISNDVTDQVLARKRIEDLVRERTAELQTTNLELQRSNDDLAQFAYIASHDLQEPLRKISTFCQMITNRIGSTLDEKSAGQLNKILSSAGRMQALVQDVLAYSQLSSRQRTFTKVSLLEIIQHIIADFELKIEQENAEIILGDLPVIDAQPLQMTQLFTNMVSNALKFASNTTRPVIEILLQELSLQDIALLSEKGADNYIKIIVRDNGIGFKPEYGEKIFTIFQRLHSKTEYEGTGIGLAICKKIVTNHQGILRAEGKPGNGACFTILLPRYQSSSLL